MFKELDLEAWPRRTTYEFFKNYEDPFFNFTANVDVTRLYRFCKESGLAYSLAGLFYSQQTVNSIPEFSIRLMDEKLVRFDEIHATQTVLNEDETFSFCYFENKADVFEFDAAGKAALEKYKALKTFDVESDRLDMIYYSVIPWVSFTSFKHATRIDKTQTVPRIVFGKIFDDGPVKKMPVSVEVNHAMMDGLHVGKYFNMFQEAILSL
jgi:chloramphenicol O-acetyltransferase type A